MKVIWVYENIKEDYSFYTKLDTLLLLSSAIQWKKHHPGYTTVLYCDDLTKNFLIDLSAISLWDSIVSLPKNNFVDKSIFWASSKTQVLRNIKEPIILLDHDFLVFKSLKKYIKDIPLFAHEEDGVRYYPTANDPFINEVADLIPRPKPFAINCCFSYFPDYKFANKYGKFALELMTRFTDMKVPNSKFLIFAEQLSLKYLLDFDKIKYEVLMQEIFLANERKFVPYDKGLIQKNDIYKYFKHYWMDKPDIRKDNTCIDYINLVSIVKQKEQINLKLLDDLKP